MKYYMNLFLVAMLSIFFQPTQAQTTSSDYIYTVYVGAFVKAQVSDFDDIRQFGFVYARQLEDHLMQIFLGGFESRRAAQAVLSKVQENGYPDAYLNRRAFDEGQNVATVQIALKNAHDEIDWGKYLKAGKIYIAQNNNQLRIFSGQYGNKDNAKNRMAQLRKAGFSDAFVKIINNVHLIKATEFETDGAEADEAAAIKDTPKGGKSKTEKVPDGYDILFKKSGSNNNIPTDRPTSYGGGAERIIIPKENSDTPRPPKIRVNQKRTSALELQSVLKTEGYYKMSVDGQYGKGTAKAYQNFRNQNRQYRKYLVLSNLADEEARTTTPSRLQASINNLPYDGAAAVSGLRASRSPLAKAYRAYYFFVNDGSELEVNRLMNAAIKGAFSNKKIKNAPPFNYDAKYAYEDLEQLLLHIQYIHAVSADAEVPCWIFSEHPKAAAAAFASASESIRMQDCGGDFMNWEETKLLKTIAADLDPAYGTNKEKQAEYAAKRARLFLSPKAMTAAEKKKIMTWHKSLWTYMDNWADDDQLHGKLCTPLKVAYFQSQVRIEDYFMDKGLSYQEAKPLAMCVLQTIVGTHFIEYMKG